MQIDPSQHSVANNYKLLTNLVDKHWTILEGEKAAAADALDRAADRGKEEAAGAREDADTVADGFLIVPDG